MSITPPPPPSSSNIKARLEELQRDYDEWHQRVIQHLPQYFDDVEIAMKKNLDDDSMKAVIRDLFKKHGLCATTDSSI